MRGLAWRTVCTVRVFFLRGAAAGAAANVRRGALALRSESEMQALRQRIADLNATIVSPECKVRVDVGVFLPFMTMESLKIIADDHG